MEGERTSTYSTLAVGGLAVMIGLSVVGATIGAAKSASAAAMVVGRRQDLLTRSYIPVLLSSACFLYAVIMVMVALPAITPDMSLRYSLQVGAAAVIFGAAALSTGLALGHANKKAIVALSENARLFAPFLIINSSMEVPAVFAMIIAILLITSGKGDG